MYLLETLTLAWVAWVAWMAIYIPAISRVFIVGILVVLDIRTFFRIFITTHIYTH
ncbi:hypothetical protein B0T26DRAFT_685086, partial [Lasiosphaeria miniovina]